MSNGMEYWRCTQCEWEYKKWGMGTAPPDYKCLACSWEVGQAVTSQAIAKRLLELVWPRE